MNHLESNFITSTPAGAKLSKNSYKVINIVTDVEGKKKEEALA